MRALSRLSAALAIASLLAACGDESFSPTVDNVPGTYTASSFTLTSAGVTVDLLDQGASVEVTLAPSGTTTGRVFVPDGLEGGEDLDEDLTGTWALNGSTVTFDHTADTFLRDLQFQATRNRLTSEATFFDETIRIVLTKPD
ncbi:MAG TPA: hypothetical protein VEB59_06255 [Gemmatimonadales bacterium]|nr:hypothetical protein [Gemmatimonadales bacterium]